MSSRLLIFLTLAAAPLAAAPLVDWNLQTVTGPETNNSPFAGVPAATASTAANVRE